MKFINNIFVSVLQPVISKTVVPMEQLDYNSGAGQGYGFTLYRTNLSAGQKLTFKGQVRDRGQVCYQQSFHFDSFMLCCLLPN